MVNMLKKTTTLYRPVSYSELVLVKKSGWKEFPPRLPEQPIFYPVMNEEYAIQIARDSNMPAYGAGYVLKFDVDTNFLSKYKVENVGGPIHNELWIPAEDLQDFNAHIIGVISVTQEFLNGTTKL